LDETLSGAMVPLTRHRWLANGTAYSGWAALVSRQRSYRSEARQGTVGSNGDGLPDLLLRHTQAGEVEVWVLHGVY
jgi:hypothetical protein